VAEPVPATVLLVAGYGGPYRGSFIPAVQALAGEARARGWSLECGFTPIARDRPWLAALEEDRIPVAIAPDGGRAALTAWLADRLDRLDGPAIVHTHFTSFDLPAAQAARDRDAAVIWHVHSFLPGHPLRVASAAVKYGWIGRRVSRILCAGEGPARSVRRRGAPAAKVAILQNGIDTGRFRPPQPGERERARAELGLPADAAVLLHFGWSWEVKGGPLFAATLARVRERGVPALGLSVGAGPEAAAAAVRLGLEEALRTPGPDEDVRRFYVAADALLATSADEGSPFSLLEALACGLPVIATDIAGHRIAPDAPRALRLSAAEPDALAERTAEALGLAGPERAAETAEASRWVAAERDVAGWAAAVARFYDAAINAPGAAWR
jgi:glycosyltransferase involved in cell wall biosynthesis